MILETPYIRKFENLNDVIEFSRLPIQKIENEYLVFDEIFQRQQLVMKNSTWGVNPITPMHKQYINDLEKDFKIVYLVLAFHTSKPEQFPIRTIEALIGQEDWLIEKCNWAYPPEQHRPHTRCYPKPVTLSFAKDDTQGKPTRHCQHKIPHEQSTPDSADSGIVCNVADTDLSSKNDSEYKDGKASNYCNASSKVEHREHSEPSLSSPIANSSVTRQDPKAFQKTTRPKQNRGHYSGKEGDNASKEGQPLTGMSDLHCEILHGTYENIVMLLSSAKADLEKPNSHGYYPVHTCVHKRDTQILEALIQANVNLNSQTDKNKSTPLHIAIAKKSKAMIKTLGQHGADFHIKNAAGFSPLENIVQTGQLPLVRLAIEDYSASPFRAGFSGKSLVDFAKQRGQYEIASYLQRLRY